jgi:hypothetical protein
MAANPEESGLQPVVSRFTIESFAAHHPGLDPSILVPATLEALAHHHISPAEFKVISPRGESSAWVEFSAPDPRTRLTLERELIVELGAIVMGGLLLAEFEGKRIQRVMRRRGRADYFVSSSSQEGFWLLEVSGTDRESIQSRKRSKIQQLSESPYISDPDFRGGFVAITRFAPPAISLIERWSP